MWAAFNGINVIQGKPTLSPQLMLALIRRSGQLELLDIADDGSKCTVTMKRKGDSAPHTESFSAEDAARMKTTEWVNGEKKTIALAQKYNWQSMPVIMRKWRAVSACARIVFPDVIIGFYTPEEIDPDLSINFETGEIDPDAPNAPAPALAKSPEPIIEGDDLVTGENGASSASGDAPQSDQAVDQFTKHAQKIGAVEPEHWFLAEATGKLFWQLAQQQLQFTPDEVYEVLGTTELYTLTISYSEACDKLKEHRTKDISDLYDINCRDLKGNATFRVREYSVANSNTNAEKHWRNRFAHYFQRQAITQLNMTVRAFVEQMATPHNAETDAA
jgi:hypothetical protein